MSERRKNILEILLYDPEDKSVPFSIVEIKLTEEQINIISNRLHRYISVSSLFVQNENELIVIIRDDNPLIHCNSASEHYAIHLTLSEDQIQSIKNLPAHSSKRFMIPQIEKNEAQSP